MSKLRLVSLSLFLFLCLSSCASDVVNECPPRPAFTGVTFGDVIVYCKNLEDLYDGCADKR